MSNETKKTALPKLRFPEFEDADDWVEKPLGNIMTVTSCKRVHESDWTTEGVPFFRAREIVALRNKLEISPLFISETLYQKNIKQSGEIKPGDLLVTGVGTIGVPYPVKEGDRFYFKDGNIIWFQNPGDIVSGNFLFWLYESNYIKKQISRMAGVGTVGTYTIDNAKRTLIPLSSKEEQQKIANCFSSLDDLINAQNAKLAALRAHKRGLMQRLFPAEGETVPKLRFAEFQDVKEWVEKPLGEYLSQHPEYGINAAAVPFSDTLPTYLRITDISEEGQYLRRSKVSVAAEVTENSYLYDGDIVLARTGASVGKSYKYRIEDGKLVFAGFLIRVRPNAKKISSEFLYQFLSTEQYWRWVAFISTRSGQPGINGNEYASMPLPLPPTLEEQQKIADCLSSLDDRITAQSQKIEALNLHKKGLMQNLFPAAAESNI